MSLDLVPASEYTAEQLTDIYNQTRVDYMVPMPMNVARLNEYMHLYQVRLDLSLVANFEGQPFGLGMLAVRPNRSWITRLGLVANQRRMGVGSSLMRGMLENSDACGIEMNMLEVIKGNDPAHQMFLKFGFQEQRELLILRRAPAEVKKPTAEMHWMERGEILFHLGQRKQLPAWTTQTESIGRAKGIQGFKIYTKDGGQAWLVFQRTLFNLSRLMFGTQYGDKHELMYQLLLHLHTHFPKQDTYTENIPADDPHLLAFYQLGYFEAFRRIEMYRHPDIANFT